MPAGLGSAVSCLAPLYRNREALLSGLTQASVVCGISSTSSSSSHMAAAYLWDLRRPRRPVSSLNFVPEPQAASPAGPSVSTADGGNSGDTGAAACVSSISAGAPAGVPGILCLSVHEDGALAAAGFRDGKVLTWDMRQVRVTADTRLHESHPSTITMLLWSVSRLASEVGSQPPSSGLPSMPTFCIDKIYMYSTL
jgi:hypothetical protein